MNRKNPKNPLFSPVWWRNVEVTPSCWLWKGYCNSDGYGRLKTPKPHNKTVVVHRYVYKLLVGEIPYGMQLDHKYVTLGCPRNCVNPDHLRVTTPKQNLENYKATKLNTKTGLRNVRLRPNGSYSVIVYSEGKSHYGGTYKDIDKAEQAALELRNSLFTHNEADRLHPF